LASNLKLAARCPVSGCWPSCILRTEPNWRLLQLGGQKTEQQYTTQNKRE